jgi:glycosyltransferase involved in cell wall biosynthesis
MSVGKNMAMINKPEISICIATFNGEKFIIEQLNSIYASLAYANITNFEVIVSDDGSSDSTLDLLSAFHNPNLFVVMGPRKGINKNFESLITRAKGSILFCCDQDDVWLPNRVSRALELGAHRNLVLAEAYVVDSDLIGTQLFNDLVPRSKGFLRNMYRNSFTGAFLAGPLRIFETALPFPKSGKVMYDWWIGIVCIIEGINLIIDDKPTVKYRRHSGNQTIVRSTAKMTKAAIVSRIFLTAFVIKYSVRRLLNFLRIVESK